MTKLIKVAPKSDSIFDELKFDPLNSRHNQPTISVAEILSAPFTETLRNELAAQIKQRLITENWDFLNEIYQTSKLPDTKIYPSLEAIIGKYILENNEETLNISEEDKAELLHKVFTHTLKLADFNKTIITVFNQLIMENIAAGHQLKRLEAAELTAYCAKVLEVKSKPVSLINRFFSKTAAYDGAVNSCQTIIADLKNKLETLLKSDGKNFENQFEQLSNQFHDLLKPKMNFIANYEEKNPVVSPIHSTLDSIIIRMQEHIAAKPKI